MVPLIITLLQWYFVVAIMVIFFQCAFIKFERFLKRGETIERTCIV